MIEPKIEICWTYILIAIITSLVFSTLWYGPLMGKKWAALMGMDFSKKPPASVMKKAFFLQVVGLVLTCYVLTHSIQIWMPKSWGFETGTGSFYIYGFFGAFFTWLGFFVPQQLGKIAWEMRPNKLFFINAGHDLINLMIVSMILAFGMR